MSGKRLKIAKRCFAVYHSFHHRLERLRPEDSSTFLETVSKDQIEKVETEFLFEVRQQIRKYGWLKFAASYSLPSCKSVKTSKYLLSKDIFRKEIQKMETI